MASVTIADVEKVYADGTHAVKDLSIDVADGELLVLVGPSGCGKTTALRMVAGLEEISGGTISIGDQVINHLDPGERDIAMVFQSYALYPHMSIYDNIAFPLKLAKVPKAERDEKVRRISKVVGLDEHLGRKPRQLSGGQRQRVAMARAIVREPQAFLMDEPLSNLDAKLRVQMRAGIAELQRELGVTTLYVTHDQVEAMTLGDRVAVMRKGYLQQLAPPEEIYRRPANMFVASFTGSPPMNLMAGRLGDDGATLAVGDCELRLAESERRPQHARFAGRDVVVGIRPERTADAALGDGGGAAAAGRTLRGVVAVREALGSDVLVYFHLDGLRALPKATWAHANDVAPDEVEREVGEEELDRVAVVARLGADSRVRVEDRVEVVVEPGAVQLFDPETGDAIA
ncbi:ABC transporter ATP-binding protein [Conexibacter arvalis]|uniref:Multiple sugar transport system ATP-binding protein n=1 Tax=Conexibacter arvalis TaxID=912552 RepID=A0A840IDF2_9ACTN|nr:sn-glycerol-3-phosphate ABC transporter ATP-binding protein UgpC [Conexibacter arvalis]MBB4662836.1 multiple sugar transport system ATP-binding protein [Conexibacter arvalis]